MARPGNATRSVARGLHAAPVVTPGDAVLRQEVSDLRGLLALSMLMSSRRDEDEIVHIVVTALPSLLPMRPVGVQLTDLRTRWVATAGAATAAGVRAALAEELRRGAGDGGPVRVPGSAWAWGVPLRSLGSVMGHLVVTADAVPSATDLLMLRSLAQQTGIALANARLHERNRQANEDLARSVEALRYKSAIHEALTQVEVCGSGLEGIVTALHSLTGLTACIETLGGAVLAWAGPGEPDAWGAGRDRREQVLQRTVREGQPVRIDGRLLAAARPHPEVVGLLSLLDPSGCAGEQEIVALEHARTVLSIELSRQHSLAETEMRLGRDLAADLLAGTGEDAHRRARALGYDLRRPHAVVALLPGSRPDDPLMLDAQAAVDQAFREPEGPPVLVVRRESTVVALVPADVADDAPRLDALVTSLGPDARVAVGGTCTAPQAVPRSLREAEVALRISRRTGRCNRVARFDELGVYRLLAQDADPSVLDRLVEHWLGPLVDYDRAHGSDLVTTLSRFLDCGGNYDAAAEAMTIGRSTVRYRLGRIRELTGHDLADAETRFQVHLALKAWATQQALDPAPGPTLA
jgi:sugar diacid utilization regulator